MKGERDNLGGGLPNPTDGWHALEIDDKIEFMKDADGAANAVLVIWMSVIEDEKEEGRRVRQSFDLKDKRGMAALATLLFWSKLYAAIEKNFKITDGGSLNEEAWGEKYLCVEESGKAAKIIDAVISKLPGKSIFAETLNKTVPVTDRNDPSKKIDRTFCNIIKLRHFGDKEVAAKMKLKKTGGGTGAADVKTEGGPAPDAPTEDWPED